MENNRSGSGLSIASMVLGIIGIITSCIFIGIIPCAISLIFALIALIKKSPGFGMAVTGLVTSLIGISFFLFVFIIAFPNNSTKDVISNQNLDKTEIYNQQESENQNEDSTDITKQEKTSNVTMGQKNALRKANLYLSISGFSYNGLIKQLEFEGFSTEEATYAVDNCGADWNEQATKKAKEYLNISGFSRNELIRQLEFEGFTSEQAEYAANTVGY